MRIKKAKQLEHVVLLSRIEGFSSAARKAGGICLGSSGAKAASAEIQRLIDLDPAAIDEECKRLPNTWLRKKGFDLEPNRRVNGYWIPGLFHAWLLREVARAMDAETD